MGTVTRNSLAEFVTLEVLRERDAALELRQAAIDLLDELLSAAGGSPHLALNHKPLVGRVQSFLTAAGKRDGRGRPPGVKK